MMYASIDSQIQEWASANSLHLYTKQGDQEIRCAYVSSLGGECFQIWIDPPRDGRTSVHVGCVEGRRDTDDPVSWAISVSEVAAALNIALEMVLEWMTPSTRYFPNQLN